MIKLKSTLILIASLAAIHIAAAAPSWAAESIWCTVTLTTGGVSGPAQSYIFEPGKLTLQGCILKAKSNLSLTKNGQYATIDYTHYSREKTVDDKGSGWTLTAQLVSGADYPKTFNYSEF